MSQSAKSFLSVEPVIRPCAARRPRPGSSPGSPTARSSCARRRDLVRASVLAFDDRDRDAGVGEVHRDAAAHGAGPEHAGLWTSTVGVSLAMSGILFAAFGEEGVALRSGLGPVMSSMKSVASTLMPSSNGRLAAASMHRMLYSGARKPRVLRAIFARKSAKIWGSTCRRPDHRDHAPSPAAAIPRRPARRTRRRRSQRLPVPVHDLVDQAVGRCFGGGQVTAGGHCLEGLRHADQSGKRCVPPAPGKRPMLTSGSPYFEVARPTR